jgi:hypothetical protein
VEGMLKDEPLDAGVEEITITLKSNLDLYIGQILETTDTEGHKVLCAVTEINSVKIKKGKLSLDCKMLPLHLINGV